MNETTGVIRNKINMVLAYKSTPTEIVNKVLDNLCNPEVHGMNLPNESGVEILGLHRKCTRLSDVVLGPVTDGFK